MVVIILSAEESDQCSEGVEGKMQFLLPDPGGRREALFPAEMILVDLSCLSP